MKNYETEAHSRWGNTDAYREYETKLKNEYKVYILEDLSNLVGFYEFTGNSAFILTDK